MQRLLYHFPLSPFSRKVRIMLAEKKLDFDLQLERYWERRRDFIALNPASQVPVLKENGQLLADSGAICEYLEEMYPNPPMIGRTTIERAEVRRLSGWFNNKFYYEVTKYILDERVLKFYRKDGEPRCEYIRAAQSNILYHLEYIAFLTRGQNWLAGDRFSMADVTAAAHLSVLDYLNEVPWHRCPSAKDWYALVKSRPSMKAILQDKVTNFKPSPHYANLDF